MNVYDSPLPRPEGTQIKRLRIVQVYPFICGASHKGVAGAVLMSMARSVLGTVPVEPDGSVHFEAPAGKVLYFQALDERGMAVQSMKSAAYVAPGVRLVCQGCHERRYDAPKPSRSVPIALRRAASKIEPDVPGSDPGNRGGPPHGRQVPRSDEDPCGRSAQVVVIRRRPSCGAPT